MWSSFNTSFNLHGFPVVKTLKDALFVLNNSGLDVLYLNYIVLKIIGLIF